MSRTMAHVREHPMTGDIFWGITSDAMHRAWRVLGHQGEWVWIQEYGQTPESISIDEFRASMDALKVKQLLRGGDHECPF